MKSLQHILNILKTNGPQSARQLAEALKLTTMGVRQHLLSLEHEGKVVFEDRPANRGRPVRYWILTELANEDFDNQHEELTLQLIDSVRNIFGEHGLDQLIHDRERKMQQSYSASLAGQNNLEDKLQTLVKLRTAEGYMATLEKYQDHWQLLENHCPICAAAKRCQNFCRSELSLFQQLLTGLATVQRQEHIVEGARRCAYCITPV